MALTDLEIKNAKPKPKPYRIFDSGGLYIEISPTGGKLWRLKYRFDGKEKRLALGVYPTIGSKEARAKREIAKRQLSEGVDPSAQRKAQKAAKSNALTDSFERLALEWFETHKNSWAPSHSSKIIRRLERDVFPWIGKRPIAELSAPEILQTLRRIQGRGVIETAHRASSNISQVMRYAIATGRAFRDPVPDLKGALPVARAKNFASITEPAKVGELLRAFDGFQGTLIVRSALLLAPLVFVRPGELRKAEWANIDLEKCEWSYFVTKTKTEHLVPLASQAINILRELKPLTGRGHYVFPGRNPQKPMSEAAINAALRRLGYDTKTEITGHGFRAMARTILAEELDQKPEVIEHQLAHAVPDSLGSAYNRTKFLKERKVMMQLWANYLDELKKGAEVIAISAA